MFLPDFVVRGRRVVTPRGIRPAAVHIRNGRIIGVVDFDETPAGCQIDEAGEHAVLPGLVDTHVYVREPGRTTSEAFARTTRAAASGGVTTIIAMPFDSGPPTTTAEALESKCRAAQGQCFVDVGFWGGVVPGNQDDLAALFQAGVRGFTCAFVSADADDGPAVSASDLGTMMPALARLGAPLLAHAELPGPIEQAAADRRAHRAWFDRVPGLSRAGRRYASYLDSRPKAAEDEAIALLIQFCQEYRLHTHIVHLSSSDALTPIFHARSKGLPLTAETCPHYLTFVAEEIPNGAIEYTCAPPIRERANREFLWAALAGGLIQSVVSGHRAMPRSPSHNFLDARRGIAAITLGLSIVWTEAKARGYSLEEVVKWMCHAPAQLAGLNRKGSLDAGYDADLVVFDPEAEFPVTDQTDGRCPSPYTGRRLRGVVTRTYLRGDCTYDNGRLCPSAAGRFLLRQGKA